MREQISGTCEAFKIQQRVQWSEANLRSPSHGLFAPRTHSEKLKISEYLKKENLQVCRDTFYVFTRPNTTCRTGSASTLEKLVIRNCFFTL